MTSISDIHVLVVDDNKQMRFLLRCLLRAGGIVSITEADSAYEAFDTMRVRPIDLVIVDWMMRPVDGLAFTRMMRWNHDSPNPYIPLLMLTAHTEASRVAAARDAGVSGFIRKPVSARTLFERISTVLTDPRMFVRTEDFMGPDRRRGESANYSGPLRRAGDRGQQKVQAAFDTIDLDDERWRA